MADANDNLRLILNYLPDVTFGQLVELQKLLRENGLSTYPLQERLTGITSEQLNCELDDLELYKIVTRNQDRILVTGEGSFYLDDFSKKYPRAYVSKIEDIAKKCE